MVRENKKIDAIALRLQGRSYGEIMRKLHISSKGTLSYWFRDLTLSTTARKRLQNNINRAYQKGLFAFNKRRTKSIRAENKALLLRSNKEIPTLSLQEIMLVGAALYWGEGVNRELSKGYPLASFTNSDPKMVKVFMRYLREVLQVKDEKITAGVVIYPNLDAQKVRRFWSRITNLDEDKFWISVAVSKVSKKRKPLYYLPNGTVHIRINSRQVFYRIQGHIDGIAHKLGFQ